MLLRYRRMAQPAQGPEPESARHLGTDSAQQIQTLMVPTVFPKAVWSLQEFMHLQGDVSRLRYIPVLHERNRQGEP